MDMVRFRDIFPRVRPDSRHVIFVRAFVRAFVPVSVFRWYSTISSVYIRYYPPGFLRETLCATLSIPFETL